MPCGAQQKAIIFLYTMIYRPQDDRRTHTNTQNKKKRENHTKWEWWDSGCGSSRLPRHSTLIHFQHISHKCDGKLSIHCVASSLLHLVSTRSKLRPHSPLKTVDADIGWIIFHFVFLRWSCGKRISDDNSYFILVWSVLKINVSRQHVSPLQRRPLSQSLMWIQWWWLWTP